MGRTVRAYSGAGVLLFLGMLLLAASLWERAELLALGDAVARQEVEIHRLEEKRAELQTASGVETDLEAVERIAEQELGMGKPREDQILYGRVSLPDRVEIVGKEMPRWRECATAFCERLRHVFPGEDISCD